MMPKLSCLILLFLSTCPGLGTIQTAVAQSQSTLTFDAPQTAGISGYRKMWDQPVTTAPNGLRVVVEPQDKDYAIRDRGGVAPWATPTLEKAGKPGALAFDAIHRTLLVRFPDAAEKIAAQINRGYTIQKVELLLPFEDEELWPEGGGFNPASPPPGYGYEYRSNWGIEWGYRVVRPRWHAVATALRRPWRADPEIGPTYNAYINGAGYWKKFGAQDSAADRFPIELKPAEVSYQQTLGRIDLTALMSDAAYGKTLAERLRTLSDCGVALKKWETYDHLYYDGSPYEWGTGVGGRAIIISSPSLSVTFAKADNAPRVAALAPAADISALAASLKKSGTGGKPTATMPSPEQIRVLSERFAPRRREGMPEWQWQHIQDLLRASSEGRPDDPFWVDFLNPMLVKSLRAPASAGATLGPVDVTRSYEMWVDLYLQRPYRGFHGHGTISELIQPWFEYREAMPSPVHDWFHNHLSSFLMPDRPTADTAEKRANRNYTEGTLVHPMVDTTALGAPADTTPVISSKRFDTYVAKTGDWRGNKSFYRSGFNYTMSTQNFNNNASLAALIGGGIIGSKYAMADGRNGQMEFATRLWTWYDGSSQEELDDYYFPITIKAAKLLADYGPEPFDRLLARSQLAKHMTSVVDTYHPGLRRYINGSARSTMKARLGMQEGLYAMLHTLSKTGAVTDLGAEKTVEDYPKWGHDTPPAEVARQALASPYAPLWYQRVVDDKQLPFETTANYKQWGHNAQFPVMRRSYLGHHFGIFSTNGQAGWLPITGHWQRSAQPAATARDIGTMVARFGIGSDLSKQTWFPEMGPGWLRVFGQQATLQSGPRMIIATSPGKLDSGYRITSIQSSLAFFNYESPAPTWEIYVDGKRQAEMPIKAKAGQHITIKDGVSYIGIIPLPSTDLGRTDEVVLRAGIKQEYLGTFKATAALVVDNILLQRDVELPQAGTDWNAIDRAYGGFVLEFGDSASHKDFATFQKAFQAAQIEASYDPAKTLHEVRLRSGKDLLETGAFTTYDPGKGSADNLAPLNRLFAYQKVNGKEAYLPAGVERDSPFSQQATTGNIAKGKAVLDTTPGRQALLQWESNTGIASAWNPLPDLNDFGMESGGVKVTANGKIGLANVTLDPTTKTLTVDHIFHGNHAEQPTAATALLAFGLEKTTRIILNGQPLRNPGTATVDGKPATVIPLVAQSSPAEVIRRLQRFRVGSGQLPDEWQRQNLALQATVTATSQADENHAAKFAADGRIAAPGSKADIGQAWAAKQVSPPYEYPEGISLSFTWKEPVTIGEVVYYGRTAFLWTENFKTYELYLDDAAEPVIKGTLAQGHGPQRITLPKAVKAKSLRLKFLSSYGDYCPGAAEVQIFSTPPPAEILPEFIRPEAANAN